MKNFSVIVIIFSLTFGYALLNTSADTQSQKVTPSEKQEISPNEYFISFKDNADISDDNLLTLKRTHGLEPNHKFSKLNVITVKTTSQQLIEQMANDPRVEYIEPVPMRYPLGLKSTQLAPRLDNGLYGLLTTKALDVQNQGITGAGINIGVADTGIDYNHPDIKPNYKGGIDTVGVGDKDPFWNYDADETHGTHVAGTILAANNSSGVLGVAYSANLYHARVLGPRGGTSADIMEGVRWLVETANCKVVNLSLGGSRSSKTEKKFYKLMHNQGAIIVCATGNDAATKISYPAGYATNIAVGAVDHNSQLSGYSNTGKGIDVVAPGDNVLSSVPINQGSESSFSVVSDPSALSDFVALPVEFAGKTSGLSQPLIVCGFGGQDDFPSSVKGNIALIQRGNNTFSEKVTNAMSAGAVAVVIYNNVAGDFVATLGSSRTEDGQTWIPVVTVSDTIGNALLNQLTQANSDIVGTVVNELSNWDLYSGTSMATPHVAGVVALIWSVNPSLTNITVENILTSTSTDLATPGYDTSYGYGLVNASAAVSKAITTK